MSKGGKRDGAGRKRIGIVITTRLEENLLYEIDEKIEGKSRAEKIRNCLKKGLGKDNGEN